MTTNTWRVVTQRAARDMPLFPTLFGMVGNHEFKLVETPIIEANAGCFEPRL